VNSSGVGYIASTDAAKGGAAVLAFANDKKLKNKVTLSPWKGQGKL
jgi:predicted methyltransferase